MASRRSSSHSSLSGGGGGAGGYRRPWQNHMDMYRKVPNDILEGTKRGSILSYVSLVVMVTLIGYETGSFWSPSGLRTDLALDSNLNYNGKATNQKSFWAEGGAGGANKIRVNFNITMLDLRCEYAVIDVVSVLGTEQNVTGTQVQKHTIDGRGVQQQYVGQNRNQHDIILFDEDITAPLHELHVDGEDAIPLTEALFEEYKNKYEFVFVDFYASWCSHCVQLAPTYETLAEVMAEAGANHADDDDAMHLDVHEDHHDKKNTRKLAEEHDDHDEHDDVTLAEDHDEHDDVDDDDDDGHHDTVDLSHHDDEHIHDDDDDDAVTFHDKEYQHAMNAKLPVVVAKVDCVREQYLCSMKQRIMGYPTLRLFVNGKPYNGPEGSDYRGHRTVVEMVDWLVHIEESHKKEMEKKADYNYSADRKLQQMNIPERYRKHKGSKYQEIRGHQKHHYTDWKQSDHPGCQLSGHLMLDRVPGNFHILARSNSHDLEPTMTNTSHMINTFSIGHPDVHRLSGIPYSVYDKLRPMNGNVYATGNLHESYHHYIKIVTTKTNEMNLYQIIPNSQLAVYNKDMVPEAKFQYDLSPISVHYRMNSKRWYEYITSLFAIIGGIFTVIGLCESSIHATVTAARRRRSSIVAAKKAPSNPY